MSPIHKQTDQSNLLGSPVNVLDLSAINQNQSTHHKQTGNKNNMISGEKSALVLVQTLNEIDLTRAKVQSLLTSEEDSLDSTL